MYQENEVEGNAKEKDEIRYKIKVKKEKEDEEEDKEEEEEEKVFLKAIRIVESYHEDLNLLCTGAGMYLLGMSLGWKAFRVAHTRKTLMNYRKLLVTKHHLAFFSPAVKEHCNESVSWS
ncbi:MAG: hypothetical protein ABI270_05410 [Nitrosospira sp.]